jgi:hypothetical protein
MYNGNHGLSVCPDSSCGFQPERSDISDGRRHNPDPAFLAAESLPCFPGGVRVPGICCSKPIDFSKRSMDKTNLRRVGDKSKPCGIFWTRDSGFKAQLQQK